MLAGFTFGCEKSFGFVGENALKLKKTIELRFENSKTAKVGEKMEVIGLAIGSS